MFIVYTKSPWGVSEVVLYLTQHARWEAQQLVYPSDVPLYIWEHLGDSTKGLITDVLNRAYNNNLVAGHDLYLGDKVPVDEYGPDEIITMIEDTGGCGSDDGCHMCASSIQAIFLVSS